MAEYLKVSFKSGLCVVGPYCPLATPYRPLIHVTGYQRKFLANCYAEFSHFNFGFTILEANKILI